jgi:hypothetical protein
MPKIISSFANRDMRILLPNYSLEPTLVGRFSFAVDIVIPACLTFLR